MKTLLRSTMVAMTVIAAIMLLSTSSSDAFTVQSSTTSSFQRSHSVKMHQAASDDNDNNNKQEQTSATASNIREQLEFIDIDNDNEHNNNNHNNNPIRQERLQRDEKAKQTFTSFGNELWDLRTNMQTLSEQLLDSIVTSSSENEITIRKRLRTLESKDPEYVYKTELEKFQALAQSGDDALIEEAQVHYDLAMAARSRLPQFNLDGLWVGKYGKHGYELINVTYVGDTIMAFKVTGDKNVPRGELTFQANLSPFQPLVVNANNDPDKDGDSNILPPIILTDKAAKKWGTNQLPRYKGLGQVAEPGYKNSQWMDGQLILIGEDYFSFAWVPIEQQIFFGRPSPELALKMLKSTTQTPMTTWEKPPSLDDDVAVLKDYVASCLEITAEHLDEAEEGSEFSCIWTGAETEECYFE
mmetsp:Transcript_13570/g.38884  ORF Transcript_13570/g.38884 Transcript_13570/m.38884 type:complete len:413 (+) Transcript_13570:122-1360(+)